VAGAPADPVQRRVRQQPIPDAAAVLPLAAEEKQLPDPMTRLRAPRVAEKLVPVFTSEELSALEKTCQRRSFAQRRDAAIIAVLTATGSERGSWPGSATTRTIPGAAMSTCGGRRSRCAARAAGRGWSGSGMRLPAP
jgi:hypothetical protein